MLWLGHVAGDEDRLLPGLLDPPAKLSYSKVRAITRVATTDNEGALLEMARAGTASHLERIVRAYRSALGSDETDSAERAHDERFLQWSYDDDGTSVLKARLAPDAAALVRTALDLVLTTGENAPAGAFSPTSDSHTGTATGTLAQRRADALVVMAESFRGQRARRPAGRGPPPGHRPRRRRGAGR